MCMAFISYCQFVRLACIIKNHIVIELEKWIHEMYHLCVCVCVCVSKKCVAGGVICAYKFYYSSLCLLYKQSTFGWFGFFV